VDELCVNRFRASAWRTRAREKEGTEQTVVEWCVAEEMVEQTVHRTAKKSSLNGQINRVPGAAACSHSAATFGFGYFRGAASCQIERLGGEPVRLYSNRSFPAQLTSLPYHRLEDF
jgi:hypothetical protein